MLKTVEEQCMYVFVRVCLLELEGQQEKMERKIDRSERQSEKVNGRKMVSALPFVMRNVQLMP